MLHLAHNLIATMKTGGTKPAKFTSWIFISEDRHLTSCICDTINVNLPVLTMIEIKKEPT
jgi:hypothetical protein